MPGGPLFVDCRQLERSPTGVAVWLRSVLGEWAAAGHGSRLRLLTRGDAVPPTGLEVEPVPGPGPAWHLVAAWRALRSGGRYLSPDSFVVPLLLGRRSALVVHDLTPLLVPGAHTRRTQLSHRLLLRLAVRRAGVVIVPSLATRDDLLGVAPGVEPRVHVVPEAARVLPSPAGARPEGPYVLYVGTIEPRKNVDVLVRSFRLVAPPEWRLVLAGGLGWLSPEEETAFRAAVGSDGRVAHLGYVDDAHLAALYEGAELFVYPSSYEGFGLPVLEAMSHGVATVTSDAPALAAVAGTAAVLVPVDGLEGALADVLGRLLGSADERAALAAAGRERAKAFSWAAVADELWMLVT